MVLRADQEALLREGAFPYREIAGTQVSDSCQCRTLPCTLPKWPTGTLNNSSDAECVAL